MVQDKKRNKSIENIIGLLLIVPFYLVCFQFERFVDLSFLSYNMLCIIEGILMYFPIIIGVILVYKFYKHKINSSIFVSILIFLVITIYCYYNSNLVEHSGWDGLGIGLLLPLNSFICRILSVILYKNIVSWKKTLFFVSISILVFISMYLFGFLSYYFFGI